MHINMQVILDMVKIQAAKGLNCKIENVDKCDDRLIGKSTRQPFPTSVSVKEKIPLALVHNDLMGPFKIKSWGGARFILCIIDDATRCVRVYFLKNKGS